jgi:alkaline phosphatase
MKPESEQIALPGRRAFLKNGTLILAASASCPLSLLSAREPDMSPIRIGLITDLHYADKPPFGSRHYRETPAKLAEAAAEFRKHDLSFVVELGDLVDAADSVETELKYLQQINEQFSGICPQRHYVLGNHCVYTLTKQEFLDAVQQEKSYYSFDRGSVHFVVLDSCFRDDGQPYGRKNFQWTDANVPDEELAWLRDDLRTTSLPTVVFAHQRLDVEDDYGVRNAAAVRRVLEESGMVLAVFQGHSHANDLTQIGGIHYCTLVAMVEGSVAWQNGYSVIAIADDGTIEVSGYRRQSDYRLEVTP